MSTLESDIEQLWRRYDTGEVTAETAGQDEYATLEAFLEALEAGEIRAAEKRNSAEQRSAGSRTSSGNGEWEANEWVKQGILLNFGLRESQAYEYGDVDHYDVLPLRETADLGARGTRNTPDGTTIRRGAYLGSDCIMMSPSFVNVGAYVGDGTLVDSCDTVGSCAQIGENVKLGANTLIGGVLEPVEDAPVVVEDNVSLGAGCRVTSGFVVGENSVVGENTLLTPRIPVYDLVEEEILYGELPANRRAFTRFVDSSVSDHDLFEGGAYKPAVVATDLETETLEATEREDALRE
ncbi:2,3,4,5-tetrahydropyridine-2,6-dicarboxylate N-succinyltransferase [Natronobacterium gregoryi]|uniref:2,3,4,5-tetrahydropyridine-2,6-carboxylate N-succinyltransferase n=2 Tax=Natronobacterium gregoryi TaxID=44930 RepID=L0AGD3_NATGS|nr:2,3,4,5-tetrahydropyridine-2,6-dicarboxylate N-succinyltransferase [Natronobacterium gregoryi]AFZ72212.1 tetrahydrodipicolinate N-succinyltransferase [Natronobacterium gregoryi SP2]ELY62388.1 2,3,4,5-tetrahydropyridine-2,6-carboxylate N-succinyltransferase [Natronobacterium gregoryi SP2]PLK20162.1 2,3,4,5-tetrahydropyridine-2,6-dicarboxylate N-succinyltransferase [Natronobacterium gregoryi SP2]SFJ28199.1 2,3,4,5-tetrahydropyridine-2-carboxylate N-succinyltransferase [Natronobacterium gregory